MQFLEQAAWLWRRAPCSIWTVSRVFSETTPNLTGTCLWPSATWPRVSSESRSSGRGWALYRPGRAQVQGSFTLVFGPQTSPTAGGRLLC